MSSTTTTHYATLGLGRGCTDAQIRDAYRLLAKQHHPDTNPGASAAMARTQALNAAYEVLGDAARRRAYDQELALAEKMSRRDHPRPGAVNIAQDVHLGIQELLKGTALKIQVRDPADAQRTETYELAIPPATAPGERFRLRRAPPFERGTVVVRVKVRPDFRFKVRGADLRCDLKIGSPCAMQGGTESVRGPMGNSVRVPVPRGIASGEVIRIAGEGLPRPRGGRGDLLVRVLYRPEVRITRSS